MLASPESPIPPLPRQIGPFPVIRTVAVGGTAVVYEVRDPHTGEPLALKWLQSSLPSARLRFNLEYEVMNTLNHPNILRVDRYGLHEGMPWMTMEMVVGTPVQASCRDAGLPGSPERTRHALHVARALALALEHIHARGLIHRDLKSANLLVIEDGRCKLLDFGATRFLEGHQPITREGEFLGTFAYASPEQLRGEVLDPRADLYSFGVLLYRMVTGKRPFVGPTPQELARQHLDVPPPDPREHAPSLPPALCTLLSELLAKEPADRPRDAGAVLHAIHEIIGEESERPPRLAIAGESTRLVGRENLVASIRDRLAAHAPGELVVVCGERASGRRAVRAAMDALAEERGLEALRLDARHVERAQERVQAAVRDGVRVVRVGDLHQATPLAFKVLAELQRVAQDEGSPLLILGDWEISTSCSTEKLRTALPLAELLFLRPLDTHAVAMLVGALLHRRPPPHAIARRIRLASGGQPTYVEQVVSELIQRERLLVGGPQGVRIEWARGSENLDIPIPPGASTHVFEELARLPLASRRVLEVLAVLGTEGAGYDLLAAVFARHETALVPLVQPLLERGWVRMYDERMVLAHSVARTLVSQATQTTRMRAIRTALAAHVEFIPEGATRVGVLAESGELAQAMALAGRLIRARLSAMRPVSALEVIGALLPHAGGLSPEDQGDFHLLHATALQLAQPGHREAGNALLRARSACLHPSRRFTARLHLQRARAQRVIGHYARYRSYLERAWTTLDPRADADLAAVVASLHARALHLTGELDQAETWHARAVAVGERASALEHRLAVASSQSKELVVGALRTLAARAGEGVDEALRTSDVRSLSLFLPVWTETLTWQTRFSEIGRTLAPALARLATCEVPTYHLRGLLGGARAEVALGRLGRAQELVDEVTAALRPGEHLDLRLDVGLIATRILLDSGEITLALQRAEDLVQRASDPGFHLVTERARALWAEAAWRTGRREDALEAFERATAFFERVHAMPALAEALIGWARAEGRSCEPSRRFGPVLAWAEAESATRLLMEYDLARARTRPEARASALDRLTSIVRTQDAEITAALRVHRWARELMLMELPSASG